jgi:hypothetical protein
MKTARVQWLLEHIGELAGDDLKEAEMIKQFYEISDDEPVEQDRPEHQHKPAPIDITPAPVERGSRLEGVAALEERIVMMEATVKDLYAKIKALEARLDVGKTV